MKEDSGKAKIERTHIVNELLSERPSRFNPGNDLENDYQYMDSHIERLVREGFLRQETFKTYSIVDYGAASIYKETLRHIPTEE